MNLALKAILPLLCFMAQALASPSLVVIGGGLEESNRNVYEKIIAMAGGKKKGHMAIFGVNSGDAAGSIEFNKEIFEGRYGIKSTGVPIDKDSMAKIEKAIDALKSSHGITSPQDLHKFFDKSDNLPPELAAVEQLRKSTGIYFGGGVQSRAKDVFYREDGSQTYLLSYMRHRMEKGAVFSGTSAGAAMQSHPMITGGYSLGSLRRSQYEVTFESGFGFLNNIIVDQHFGQRGRLGRLIAAMHRSNVELGAGVDEDTALVVKDGKWSVSGTGQVYVAKLNPNGSIQGTTLTVMSEGDTYDPKTGKLTPAPSKELQDENIQLRKGALNHKGKTFESLEIEMALKNLEESTQKRVNTWNAPKQTGVGMAFSVSADTKFYKNSRTSKLTANHIKVNFLNVPNLQKNFPPRKTCLELFQQFIK